MSSGVNKLDLQWSYCAANSLRQLKHAFLITAYRDPQSLQTLITQLLAIENALVLCHIDRRSKGMIAIMQAWVDEQQISNSHLNRLHLQFDQAIFWASSNHFQIQIEMAKQALLLGADYYHTLTGQCRLLCSPAEFLHFFDANAGLNFIEHFELPAPHWSFNGGLDRIRFFELYDLIDIKKWGPLFDISNRFLIGLQGLLKINRLPSYGLGSHSFWGGLGYWSLCQEAVNTLVQHRWIKKRHYRLSSCAEEFVPHSILLNSPYGQKHRERFISNHLRFISWDVSNGESPGILDMSHFDAIAAGQKNEYPYLFARKFDSRFSLALAKQLSSI